MAGGVLERVLRVAAAEREQLLVDGEHDRAVDGVLRRQRERHVELDAAAEQERDRHRTGSERQRPAQPGRTGGTGRGRLHAARIDPVRRRLKHPGGEPSGVSPWGGPGPTLPQGAAGVGGGRQDGAVSGSRSSSYDGGSACPRRRTPRRCSAASPPPRAPGSTRRSLAATPAQLGAWDAISSGQHALVVAPTGSGKTLAAFLWALDRLAAAAAAGGPEAPVPRALRLAAQGARGRRRAQPAQPAHRHPPRGRRALGLPAPDVTVGVRSGDTPADERRRFAHPAARHPHHHARVAVPRAHLAGARVAARRRRR